MSEYKSAGGRPEFEALHRAIRLCDLDTISDVSYANHVKGARLADGDAAPNQARAQKQDGGTGQGSYPPVPLRQRKER